MRYYKILIKDVTGKVIRTYSSQTSSGSVDPGALNVEIDVPVAGFHDPMGDVGAAVRIWGISLQDISEASNFGVTSKGEPQTTIEVYGGMQAGLPLATAQSANGQQGLLVQGLVFQAFGNWVGTSMTLDFVVVPDGGTQTAPKNIVLNWLKGTQMGPAVKQTLQTAFPGYAVNVTVSQNLVLPDDQVGAYSTVKQFATIVRSLSASIVGGTYQGVAISLRQKTFTVQDGTSQTKPRAVAFTDLIGQPTWIDFPTIQLIVVMRADLNVGDFITIPAGLQTTTPQSNSQFRDRSAFQGTFQIVRLRHVGNFRQPDGQSWVTVINANPTTV